MYSLNRAMIIGNVTRDPEMKYTPNGQAVCRLGVATNRRWTSQSGETQEKVEFHDITLWRKLAEITSQFVKKGQKIYVEGHLETRNWEAPDGTKRQKTEIVADNIIMLSPKGEYSASPSAPSPASADSGIDNQPQEDIDQTKEYKSDKNKTSKTKKDDDKASSDEINLDEIPF